MVHICELYTPVCSIYLEINISVLEIIFLGKFTSLPFSQKFWSFTANSRELNIFHHSVLLYEIFNSR